MSADSERRSLRRPAVAGSFYPAEPGDLEREVRSFLKEEPPREGVLGAVIPHAGYVYSGPVAGETVSRIRVPGRVVLLGPNHTGMGAPVSVHPGPTWWMPFGQVTVDRELAGLFLEEAPQAETDERAHLKEHCLEVQLPFLHYRRGSSPLVTPVVLSFLPGGLCRSLGEALARAIARLGEPVLIVASSDMTHYEDQASAAAKDRLAIERVLALDPDGLLQITAKNRITMCGVIPAAVMLHACLALGAAGATLVRYSNSGEASGNFDQVVGYAGILVHRD